MVKKHKVSVNEIDPYPHWTVSFVLKAQFTVFRYFTNFAADVFVSLEHFLKGSRKLVTFTCKTTANHKVHFVIADITR